MTPLLLDVVLVVVVVVYFVDVVETFVPVVRRGDDRGRHRRGFFFFFFLHGRRNLLRKNPDKDVVTEGQKASKLRAGSEQSRTGHERKVQQAKQAESKDKKR